MSTAGPRACKHTFIARIDFRSPILAQSIDVVVTNTIWVGTGRIPVQYRTPQNHQRNQSIKCTITVTLLGCYYQALKGNGWLGASTNFISSFIMPPTVAGTDGLGFRRFGWTRIRLSIPCGGFAQTTGNWKQRWAIDAPERRSFHAATLAPWKRLRFGSEREDRDESGEFTCRETAFASIKFGELSSHMIRLGLITRKRIPRSNIWKKDFACLAI